MRILLLALLLGDYAWSSATLAGSSRQGQLSTGKPLWAQGEVVVPAAGQDKALVSAEGEGNSCPAADGRPRTAGGGGLGCAHGRRAAGGKREAGSENAS